MWKAQIFCLKGKVQLMNCRDVQKGGVEIWVYSSFNLGAR